MTNRHDASLNAPQQPTTTRRTFLKCGIATATCHLTGVSQACAAGASGWYAGLNSGRYLGKPKVETPIVDKMVFTEGPAVDRTGNVLFTNVQAFEISADDSVTNQRTLINFYPGRSGDGMCIDSEGNLYVAAGLHALRSTSETLDTRPGIHVISPKGKLLAFVKTPVDTVTNCTFGGMDLRTLYVTCGKFLVSIPTRIPGKASYRPEQ